VLISYSIRSWVFHKKVEPEGYNPAFGTGVVKSIALIYVWRVLTLVLMFLVNTQLPPYRGKNAIGWLIGAFLLEGLFIGIVYMIAICVFRKYSEYKQRTRYFPRMLNLLYSPYSVFNCLWFMFEGCSLQDTDTSDIEESAVNKEVTATS
jgi:hypothetical protein